MEHHWIHVSDAVYVATMNLADAKTAFEKERGLIDQGVGLDDAAQGKKLSAKQSAAQRKATLTELRTAQRFGDRLLKLWQRKSD